MCGNCKTNFDRAFNHGWPAETIEAWASEAELERHQLIHVLNYVRQFPEYYGWTVPHARRGRPTGKERFTCVLVDSETGRIHRDSNQIPLIQAGHLGTLRTHASHLEHQAVSFEAIAPDYKRQPRLYKMLTFWADRCHSDGRGVRNLVELMEAENGA